MSIATSTREHAPDSEREPAPLSRVGHAPRAPARHPLVIPLAVLYAATLIAWCALRHRHFGSSAFELGAYHSVLWNVAYRGTPWNSLERAHQWSTHLELGLAPLVPLYRIVPSPVWLWLAEGVACGAAALPLDALARRVTGDAVVGLVAAAALLFTPQLVLGQVADFQPIALAILPVAVMAWAVEVDSSRGLVLGALGAILLREQLGAVVAVAAALWVLRQGMRRAPPAAVLAVLAVAVSALEILVIIPSLGSEESLRVAAQYGVLGGGTAQRVRFVVTALTGDRRVYVLGLASGALPLVFLSLRSLRTSAWPLLLGVPPLAVQLFSSEPRKWDLDYPYGVPVVAAFAAAAVLALRFLPANTPGSDPVHGRPPAARRLAVVGWLALVLVHLVSVVPSPFGPGRAIDTAFAGSVRASALDHAIGLVPADASISAQDDIVPHVAARSEVHRWPDGSDTDEYVLLDLDGAAANVKNRAALIVAGRQLRADTGFEVLLDQAGVIVARRRAR
jgi:uncharacterized membrane protein